MNNNSPNVYIIILNWNKWEDTIECLHSVYAMDYNKFEVLVIDNASENDSIARLRSAFPTLRIIENTVNNGFTGGNNQGINIATSEGADYIWLLNNDTEVETFCLGNLITAAEADYKIGLLSPVIKYYEDKEIVQFSGSYIDMKSLSIYYPSDKNINDKRYQTENNICLWGTALLIRVELVAKHGGLNDKYFAYYEDTEYSIRSLSMGYKNILVNNAIVYHKHQQTSKSVYYCYFMSRNSLLLLSDYHMSFYNKIIYHRKRIGGLIKNINSAVYHDGKKHIPYLLNGYWHGLCGINGPIHEINTMPILLKKILTTIASKKYSYLLAHMISGEYNNAINIIKNRIKHSISSLSLANRS